MTAPEVEVRRSKRRRRTVSAYREDERIVILVPASFTAAEESEWVATMVRRIEKSEQHPVLTDDDLLARALRLSDEYLGGLATPGSVRWVSNQRTRWGSCTPSERTIRLSERLQTMPVWVLDYVIVHELAHLLEPGHDESFWAWVDRYPKSRKAQGYLLGWSEGAKVIPPSEFAD
ncbi:M48 family metallopeptidase [Nocardioides sp.]|uniref:M48 metallopeptidase family protein n=1 Tax=Nocardioides sp. TaxID=35761 RepID=UPI002B266F34|nr:M48 family metallopeptidase [Nocardioides sp.]